MSPSRDPGVGRRSGSAAGVATRASRIKDLHRGSSPAIYQGSTAARSFRAPTSGQVRARRPEALVDGAGRRAIRRRGPVQKQVWGFAKEVARGLAAKFPELITAEYRLAKRPPKHVLVDYNQNAWGRTLASVYSVRPQPGATVSTPVAWEEIERGIKIEDFRIDNVPARVGEIGDLFRPLLLARRVRLDRKSVV